MTENNPAPQVDLTPPNPDRVYDHDAAVLLRLTGDETFEMMLESVNGAEDGDRYTLNQRGVWRHYFTSREGERRGQIATLPIIVSRQLDDDQGGVSFEVAWINRAGDVKREVVNAETITDHNKLFRVFKDAAVTSANARAFSEYLTLLISHNADWLVKTASQVMTAIGWGPRSTKLATFTAGNGSPHLVQDVRGTGRWLEAFRPEGDLQEWVKMTHDIKDQHVAQVIISAAFAAPLIRVLGVNNFVLDVAGFSSIGKTTSCQFALSAFAEPDAATLTCQDSMASIGHYLAMARGVPVLLDETQSMDDKDTPSLIKLAYDISHGRSKAKGQKSGEGLQQTTEWETVLMVTGESSLLANTKKNGANARVITVAGKPLADHKQAEEMAEVARRHFGLAGPAFVSHVLGQDPVTLVLRHKALCQALDAVTDSSIARRRGKSVAVLRLANELAHEAGLTPLVPGQVWLDLTTGADTGNEDYQPAAALRDLLSWAVRNREKFYDIRNVETEPSGGWLGRWDENDTMVSIGKETVEKELANRGYQVEATLAAWRDEKWLKISSGYQHRRRIGTELPWMISVTNLSSIQSTDDVEEQGDNVVPFDKRVQRKWAGDPGSSNETASS
ncbi:DUF927 domain-containing protein [Streptomyces hokutonensis]|uniref:DUF927 domain-containing protein n=1 Tax=Streptomyces hokutonensis TaxID=1306990 RepID=UPI000365D301|nr:DUF927 domain-containing protein [Streptomyces hokutonensis]